MISEYIHPKSLFSTAVDLLVLSFYIPCVIQLYFVRKVLYAEIITNA